MDKIGIKLADGSFYPILEDGKPEKKNISLTTVKDNQSIVHVDLYRSSDGTMDDAKYVETLQIDNLKPHGNGEPNLSFSLELDEDNELRAAIEDPETGKKSLKQVNIAQKVAPPEFDGEFDRLADFSIKEPMTVSEDDIEEPIEMGKHQPLSAKEAEKPFEDIFKRPADEEKVELPSVEGENEDSFEDILDSISNPDGKTESETEVSSEPAADAAPEYATEVAPETLDEPVVVEEAEPESDLEDTQVIAPAPNDDFSFDDIAATDDVEKKEDEKDGAQEAAADTVDKGLEPPAVEEDPFDFDAAPMAEAAEPAVEEPESALEEPAEAASELTDESVFEEPSADVTFADLPPVEEAAVEETEEKSAEAETASEEPLAEDAVVDTVGVLDATVDQPDFGFKELNGVTEDNSTVSADSDTVDSDGGAPELDGGMRDAADEIAALPDFDENEGMPETDFEEPVVAESSDGNLDEAAPERTVPAESAPEAPVTESSGLPPLDDELAGLPDLDDSFDVAPLFADEESDSAAAGQDGLDENLAASVFELPDLGLDDAVKEKADTDFELPDFGSTSSASGEDYSWPSLNLDDMDSNRSSADESLSSAAPSFATANMFEDLYDKETLEGKSSDSYEETEKKARVPMMICIVCAIICVLCLLFLFIIPTKFNLLRRKPLPEIAQKTETEIAKLEETPVADVQPAGAENATVLPPQLEKKEEEKKEVVPAKENEIVIATVPSQVVPETPVKNPTKAPDIQYKVVWGDTLWDIANAYYKNPWKYTELAKYNHLKNPNFIQTGSILLIPAE